MAAEVIGRREYDGWLGFKRRYIYPFKWFYQSHIWGLRFRLRNLRMFASDCLALGFMRLRADT